MTKIFAELKYPDRYEDFHDELVAFVRTRFANVESGIQGDSWIWIMDGGEMVALDTFSSMKHQVKSPKPGPHVEQVIDALREEFELTIFDEPES
jgi:hypothetical protein